MGVRLPEDLRRRLQLAAQESGRSLTGELLFRVELTFRGHERGESLADVVADWEAASFQVAIIMRQIADLLKEQKKRRK